MKKWGGWKLGIATWIRSEVEDAISDGKFWLVREIKNDAYELVFIRLSFHPNQVDEKQAITTWIRSEGEDSISDGEEFNWPGRD